MKKVTLLFEVYLKVYGHYENIFWLATRTRILGSRFIFRVHDFFIKTRLKKGHVTLVKIPEEKALQKLVNIPYKCKIQFCRKIKSFKNRKKSISF